MKKAHSTKAHSSTVVASVRKESKFFSMLKDMIEEKDLIEKYFDGEATKSDLNAKGIKFVRAI